LQYPPVASDCWFITGPTASGKTTIGLALAELLGAEIVSLDSMAIYRGMNIGTAKPSDEERCSITHHLLDIVDPWQDFSLAQYVAAAHSAVRDVRQRGRQVVFVGGTPLYLKAMLRGLFIGPPADHDLRARLREEAVGAGVEVLHERLRKIDPAAAKRIHPHDLRRIIRAIEVYEKLGTPISELQRQFEEARPRESCRVFTLEWDRPSLHSRIEARVDSMFAQGLVEETRTLLNDERGLGRTARQALGYREVLQHLEGLHTFAETVDKVKSGTRGFARRQCTWFRSLAECRQVSLNLESQPQPTAAEILRSIPA
jgi:tRNA dimethylallyltransferase